MYLTLMIFLQGSANGGDGAGILGCAFIVIIIVIALVYGNSTKSQRAKALADAWRAYQDSLTYLKSYPTNAEVRQGTLEYGRRYSNLTRNNKGVTVYDEVALMNDINAACAGAANVTETKEVAVPAHTIEARLQRLAELKSKGLIDDEEYVARRRKILDEV